MAKRAAKHQRRQQLATEIRELMPEFRAKGHGIADMKRTLKSLRQQLA